MGDVNFLRLSVGFGLLGDVLIVGDSMGEKNSKGFGKESKDLIHIS